MDFSKYIPHPGTQEGPSFTEINALLRAPADRAENKRRYENENALAQAGSKRADSSLKLQQDYQTRKFSKEEQAEVEALIAEYQNAVAQGDDTGIAQAGQKLKRFGMNVGPSVQPKGLPTQLRPNLQALTGEKPDLAAFTGKPHEPIDDVVKTEMASRDALRARNEEPDLSQEDWERRFTSGGDEPEQVDNPVEEQAEPDIAGHLKSVGPLKALKLNPPTQDEPPIIDLDAEDATPIDMTGPSVAKPKGLPTQLQAGVMGLDADGSPPFAIGGEQPPASASPASARGLPTQPFSMRITGKNGEELANVDQSTKGRWAPMVASAFDSFTKNENPQLAAAAKEAQGLAQKLVGVDGIEPKTAIQYALSQYKDEANRINNMARTVIGSKGRGGGTGSGSVGLQDAGLTAKEIALLGDDADKIMMGLTAKPEYQKISVMDDVLNGAESALSSNDPLRQQQAISDIMRARSGLTVRKDEEQSLKNAMGLWEGLKANLSQKSGYGLTADYRRQLASAIAQQRQINQQIRHRLALEAADYYKTTRTVEGESGSRGAQVNRNAGAIGKMLERGGGSGAADPDDDL